MDGSRRGARREVTRSRDEGSRVKPSSAAPEGVVEGVDLTKRFGATEALRGVSVLVRPAEIVAILGPSGSGKSTLLLCLAGILLPDIGEARYGGRSLSTLSDADRTAMRRETFGFVFQFGHLVPELTAVDNVALPLLLSGSRRKDAVVRAEEQLEQLGVVDVAHQRLPEISGGQAQRVAVARALVMRPRVVFADEPTGALDTTNGELVMELLTAAARHDGTTVVLVTHEPQVAAYADREIVLRDGAIDHEAALT
jgi:putative ABC transport system ATP-binding protein